MHLVHNDILTSSSISFPFRTMAITTIIFFICNRHTKNNCHLIYHVTYFLNVNNSTSCDAKIIGQGRLCYTFAFKRKASVSVGPKQSLFPCLIFDHGYLTVEMYHSAYNASHSFCDPIGILLGRIY